MTFDASRIPKSLVNAYNEGRCALFVGAGASQAVGYPGWNDFLGELIQRCLDENLITKEQEGSYRELIGVNGKQLTLASALKDRLGEAWDQVISDLFNEIEKEPADVHKKMVELVNLTMVITTNYDTVIEDAYRRAGKPKVSVLTFRNGGEMRRLMLQRKFFILKAHGDAAKPGDGIILTTADYRSLSRERAYQSLLASVFTLNTVFFVGVSLNDPELIVLLDYLADTFEPGSAPIHYALVAEHEINEVERERWRKDYLVQVIPISSENNYEQVPQAMEALAQLAEQA